MSALDTFGLEGIRLSELRQLELGGHGLHGPIDRGVFAELEMLEAADRRSSCRHRSSQWSSCSAAVCGYDLACLALDLHATKIASSSQAEAHRAG